VGHETQGSPEIAEGSAVAEGKTRVWEDFVLLHGEGLSVGFKEVLANRPAESRAWLR